MSDKTFTIAELKKMLDDFLSNYDGSFTLTYTPKSIVTPPEAITAANGILIPLYSYPGELWEYLIALCNKFYSVPVWAIANPNNGPGKTINADYTRYIKRLQDVGIKVAGYVSTSYAKRLQSNVNNDISSWLSYYNPTIDGIFLDEIPTREADYSYYSEIITSLQHDNIQVILNPGVEPDPCYFTDDVIVVVHESDYYPTGSEGHKNQKAALILNQKSLEIAQLDQLTALFKWIYVTEDTLPNPWDTLSLEYLGKIMNYITSKHLQALKLK